MCFLPARCWCSRFDDSGVQDPVMFVDPPPKNLLCMVCEKVFTDPVIAKCGVSFRLLFLFALVFIGSLSHCGLSRSICVLLTPTFSTHFAGSASSTCLLEVCVSVFRVSLQARMNVVLTCAADCCPVHKIPLSKNNIISNLAVSAVYGALSNLLVHASLHL